jgi:hypothetical protein
MKASITPRRQAVYLFAGVLLLGASPWAAERAHAQAINPQAFKVKFEQARAGADVVAKARVVAVACAKADKGEEGASTLTLDICLQVEKADKGPAQQGELLLVRHQIPWSKRLGPPALYGRQSTLRSVPCVPGVTGDVALRWDAKHRSYNLLAGWVPELPQGSPPTEPGKALTASGAGGPPPR